MWKMWKMWICKSGYFMQKLFFIAFLRIPKSFFLFVKGVLHKKYPHLFEEDFPQKNVDNVDNYFFNRFSPIFTTSPAPIVINRSPRMQFFRTKS